MAWQLVLTDAMPPARRVDASANAGVKIRFVIGVLRVALTEVLGVKSSPINGLIDSPSGERSVAWRSVAFPKSHNHYSSTRLFLLLSRRKERLDTNAPLVNFID
jgi:hypothetical protein